MSLEDLNDVAEKIHAALDAHNHAVKRFATGKGNVLSIGERIKQLGVTTRRPVPAVLVDGSPVSADLGEVEEESIDEMAGAAE